MKYIENNPTDAKYSKKKGNVNIVRVSPFLDGVEVEYKSYEEKNIHIKLIIWELESKKQVFEKVFYSGNKCLRATGLAANIDYVAEVLICDGDMKEIARSNARLFRCGLYPGKVINYIHPADKTYVRSGEFIGSPCIIKMDNGSYIASHDIFSHDNTGHSSLCQFFVSKNYGKTWNYLSEIEHCTWGTMFKHNGKLYILGTSEIAGGGGDIVLYVSDDEAQSWSGPVVLVKKNKESCYRTSTGAVMFHDDRFYMYVGTNKTVHNETLKEYEDYVRGEKGQDKKSLFTSFISADLNADIENPENWTLSEATGYSQEWDGAVKVWNPIMMEEGNIVLINNELKMLLRFNSHRYDTPTTYPDSIRYLVFGIDKDNPESAPRFEKAVLFNGAMHKFHIQYDEKNQRYLAMVNRMTTDQIWQRNVLSLAESKDLEHWNFVRDLINLEDINWQEDAWECGVQYPMFFIDDNIIVAVVRTAINGADNFHNSNAITFHRFKEIFDKYRY